MTESSRFQESSSFKMQAGDGEVVSVDVFSEFVDGTTRWSNETPEWHQGKRKRFLGPEGRQVIPVDGKDLEFTFIDHPDRIFTRIAPY
jgi:hypothetical protein